jgi:DNA-directed DNA polymerase III PolC
VYIHLRTRSYYSFLSGLAAPGELAQAAAREGMPALALTDEGWLTGAVEFYDACRSAGVQPVLGLELAVAAPPGLSSGSGSLALLAMELRGWTSLCRLSSALHAVQPGEGAGILSFEQLARETAGLLCLSGGQRGLAARLVRAGQEGAAAAFLRRLEELFPGRLYVELQSAGVGDEAEMARLASLAEALALPVVATHPVHYLAAGQAGLERLLAAMRLNRPLASLPPGAAGPPGAYFTRAAEMEARFAAYPQAVAATLEIAGRCRLELPLGAPQYPEIPLPPGRSALQVLRQKAEAGAARLYGALTAEIAGRLDHELDAIGRRGYAPLFLVMEEIVDFAKRQGIPISSRGSAASSLVAHCLEITSPDPLQLNLYFERFLNPARASPPDIDTDLCSRRRDEVIHFVYERYGAERVAMVCTVNRFRRRSALREVAKAYGLPPGEVKALAEAIPHRWTLPAAAARARDEHPYAELAERYPSPVHQAIFREAGALLGLPRHLSIHPGGIVIAPGPVTDLVPTQLAAKGVIITQFDLEAIERFGLVKIDLLGIRGLTVLGDVARAIRERNPLRFTGPLAALEAIPEEDARTAEAVRNGQTIGCFQIESPGMRRTLKEIQADSVEDIMIALALYRPGPLTGGLKDDFVRRHRGQAEAEYLHPALVPLLQDTYGVILYQEQVLRIASELAGLSLADADLLRRAMSHFDPGEQMRTLKERFIAGALARSQVPEPAAERVWELMAAFAGYGFPKAHAASYAQVAWRAAWSKVHEPAVFLAAVLANWGGYYSQRVYLNEARRQGLALQPPHVNYAGREFSVKYPDGQPTLFMGLDQVRDLSQRTQARIMRQRPFRSLADFLARADPRPVEAENLIQTGALEGWGTIPALLRQLHGEVWRGGQLPLFDFAALDPADRPGEDWSLAEKVAAQEAILGVGVIAHPLELAADQAAACGALNTLEAGAQLGRRVRVAGMRQVWRRSRTTSGETLYLMSLEDLEGMLEVVISSGVYRRSQAAFSDKVPLVVEGEVILDPSIGDPFIRAEKIWKLG